MSRLNCDLIGLRLRSGGIDRANGVRGGDGVGESDERENRASNVSERDGFVSDHETALEQTVLGNELTHELRECGPWKCRPSIRFHEAAHAFALLKRFTIGKAPHKIDSLLHGLDRVQHLKPHPRGPAGNSVGNQRGLQRTHPLNHIDHHLRGQAGRKASVEIDAAPEGNERADVPGLSIGGRLVGKHSALRVSR